MKHFFYKYKACIYSNLFKKWPVYLVLVVLVSIIPVSVNAASEDNTKQTNTVLTGFEYVNSAPGDSVIKDFIILVTKSQTTLNLTCDKDFFKEASNTEKILALKVNVTLSNEIITIFDGKFCDFVKDGIKYNFGNVQNDTSIKLTLKVTLPLEATNELQGEKAFGNIYIAANETNEVEDVISPSTSDDFMGGFALLVIAAAAVLLFASARKPLKGDMFGR